MIFTIIQTVNLKVPVYNQGQSTELVPTSFGVIIIEGELDHVMNWRDSWRKSKKKRKKIESYVSRSEGLVMSP
jgi:hypothetical protein